MYITVFDKDSGINAPGTHLRLALSGFELRLSSTIPITVHPTAIGLVTLFLKSPIRLNKYNYTAAMDYIYATYRRYQE